MINPLYAANRFIEFKGIFEQWLHRPRLLGLTLACTEAMTTSTNRQRRPTGDYFDFARMLGDPPSTTLIAHLD